MSHIQQIRSELEATLEENPSKDVPYHNNEHMRGVWAIAKRLWLVECHRSDVDMDAERTEITLMIACLLHDWGHSAGRLPDVENIAVARAKAKDFMAKCYIAIAHEVYFAVDEAIACTEFPFINPPQNHLQKVLRDADLLYTASIGRPELVMEDLRVEMQVAYGRSISYREMLVGQKAFLEKAEVFTDAGQLIWTMNANAYFAVLEQYMEGKELAQTAVIDTCEYGHKFAKLPSHPLRDGKSRCPNCMSIGLDRCREEKEEQLKAILTFINEGTDELLVRRIWERAMIAGHKS